MKTLRASVAGVFLIAVAAQGQSVEYDYIDGADFSSYQGWTWRDDQRDTPNPLAAGRISESLEREFAARGYEMAPADEADFLVDFDAALSQSLRVDEIWWGRGRRRGWVREVDVTTYPVGTLAVVVIDRGSQQVVWRGVAKGAVTENREKMRKKIDKAVSKLLKKFPPPR